MLPLRIVWIVFVATLVIAALTPVAGLLIAGAAVVFVDAIIEHGAPWLSVPACLLLTGLFLGAVYRDMKDRRRMVATIQATPLHCPYCGSQLPKWDGRFRTNPDEPACVDWVCAPRGSFRLRCGQCGRDIWYYAWEDGHLEMEPTGAMGAERTAG